jgi:hypothetical protein
MANLNHGSVRSRVFEARTRSRPATFIFDDRHHDGRDYGGVLAANAGSRDHTLYRCDAGHEWHPAMGHRKTTVRKGRRLSHAMTPRRASSRRTDHLTTATRRLGSHPSSSNSPVFARGPPRSRSNESHSRGQGFDSPQLHRWTGFIGTFASTIGARSRETT